jgi:hypothetical protein
MAAETKRAARKPPSRSRHCRGRLVHEVLASQLGKQTLSFLSSETRLSEACTRLLERKPGSNLFFALGIDAERELRFELLRLFAIERPDERSEAVWIRHRALLLQPRT